MIESEAFQAFNTAEDRPARTIPQPKFTIESLKFSGFVRLGRKNRWTSARLPPDTVLLVTDSGLSMAETAPQEARHVRYRRRLRASGGSEVLFKLPNATLAAIDDLKERQGLRNRSQALLQLIERGMEAAQ